MRLHQHVRIRVKHDAFRKETIFKPSFSKTEHEILHIDKTTYPAVYTLSGTRKKFYSFQLLRVNKPFLDHLLPTQSHKKLLVQNVQVSPPNPLRSGKIRISPDSLEDVKYKTLYNGQIQFLSRNDLLLHKKLYNDDHLVYSPSFNDPEYRKYIV